MPFLLLYQTVFLSCFYPGIGDKLPARGDAGHFRRGWTKLGKRRLPNEGSPVFKNVLVALVLLLLLSKFETAHGETTKLIVAYASPAATFCPGWIAKREGIFAKYNLDVEMVLMQGASTYMPALASGNIHVLYGGGTAVSRAIATGDSTWS
jgi:hypothetical protein